MGKTSSKRILNVDVKRMVDDQPDTSWLGQFSNRAESDYAINHRERSGDRRAYEWFNPCVENYKGEPEKDIRKYCEQDYQRMVSLDNGAWCFYGIEAVADVQFNSDVVQTVRSGGLWGVESDSEASYLTSIENDQLAELRDQLRSMGFSTRAITKAFAEEL